MRDKRTPKDVCGEAILRTDQCDFLIQHFSRIQTGVEGGGGGGVEAPIALMVNKFKTVLHDHQT